MSTSTTVPDAQPAGSSPAPSTPSAPPVSGQTLLDGMSSDQRRQWELTGTLPDPTTPADSSSAPPAAQAAATAASPTSASASEPEQPVDPPKEKGAKARTAALDQEIADLRERLRIRAELRRELASTDRPTDDRRPASSPGQPSTQAEWERFAKLPTAPQEEQFEHFRDYAAAMSLFITDQRIAEHQSRAAGIARAESEIAAFERLRTDATAKIQDYTKSHPDFDQRVDPDLIQVETATARRLSGQKIGPHHVLAEEILKSPATAQLLEHFSTDDGRKEWQRLCALPYPDLLLAFGRLEGRFERAARTPEPPAAPPPKTLSTAPAPGTTLGERPTEPIDPAEAALKRKDFTAYAAAQNAKALAGAGAR